VNAVYADVLDGVATFRVETDGAWAALMAVELAAQTAAGGEEAGVGGFAQQEHFAENPFDSIFRRGKKRQTHNSGHTGLPAWSVNLVK
jgi:hypothetical protein